MKNDSMRALNRYGAEFVGTIFLLMIIVGSGIMGENLSQGNEAIVLLVNSLATGAGIFVLIRALGPISGAHLNPLVSLSEVFQNRLKPKEMIGYWGAQFLGAITGVLLAHVMFGESIFQSSTKIRFGMHLWISEAIATLGLLSTITLVGRRNSELLPLSVGAYITSAYWFTSSTSFANPAVTVGRSFTNTFCGIARSGVPPFIVAQAIGAGVGIILLRRMKI